MRHSMNFFSGWRRKTSVSVTGVATGMLWCALFLAGCNKEDGGMEIPATLDIKQTDFDMEADGESEVTAEFSVSVEWSAAVEYAEGETGGWLALSAKSGDAGETTLKMTASANPGETERKAVVTIAYGKFSTQLTVTQQGTVPDIVIENEMRYLLDSKAGTQTKVTFEVNMPWKAAIVYGVDTKATEVKATGWVSLSKTSGEAGKNTLVITVLENTTEMAREAYIDITYGSKKERITVTQHANEEIDITDKFDSKFAKALQECGYIQNADSITIGEVCKITGISVPDPMISLDYKITSLKGIEYFTALTYLECNWVQFTALDVSRNTALESLTLWVCDNLSTLDVSGCTALTYLCINGGKLTTLDLSKNTALTWLDCRYNQLTTLDVSKNTALTYLNCRGNQLTTLNVSGCTALEQLYCEDNPGDYVASFPLTTWVKGEKPASLYLHYLSWEYGATLFSPHGTKITIVYQ